MADTLLADELAAAGVAFRGPPILGVLGNSWVSSFGYNANDYLARGFGPVLAARLKKRVRMKNGAMLGLAGQTSSAIAPRIADILAAGARVILVEMLINDAPGGVTFETTRANIDIVIAACRRAGAIVVFGTIPPRSDALNTPALRQANARINSHLFDLPFAHPNVHIADVAGAITRRDSATGAPLNLVLYDGVHPLDLGAELITQPYFDVLDRILAPVAQGVWQTQTFDRASNPTGYVRDPSLWGATGTIGAGVTGTAATNFVAARNVGATFTAVAAKVAGVNGGEFQQLSFGAAGGGIGTEQINLSYNTTVLQAGDVIQGVADIDAVDLSNLKGVFCYISGAATGTWRSLLNSGFGGDLSPPTWSRLLRTMDVTVAATETIGFAIATIGKCDGAAPGGSITIREAGIRVLRANA